MFRNAKEGDRVWDSMMGMGIIIGINTIMDSVPIKVKLDSHKYLMEYRVDGKLKPEDVSPRLFWRPFEIPKEAFMRPLPYLAVDTKVLVWDNQEEKLPRYFSHFDSNGSICCFENGSTSWSGKSSTKWEKWELAK